MAPFYPCVVLFSSSRATDKQSADQSACAHNTHCYSDVSKSTFTSFLINCQSSSCLHVCMSACLYVCMSVCLRVYILVSIHVSLLHVCKVQYT